MSGSNKIIIANETHHTLGISPKKLKHFTETILKKLRYRNTVLSLVFVSDAKIKRLNQKHLRHSYATDVLAFPFSSSKNHSKQPFFLGEVIISPKRARVQARIFKATFREELLRYVCHGILHLAGYLDKSRSAQRKMRTAENKLLKEKHGDSKR